MTDTNANPVVPEVVGSLTPRRAPTRTPPVDAVAASRSRQPTKLIRIASMVRGMLDEVRRAPLDDAGRRALREIHEKSLHELEGVLSPELQQELEDVVLPFTSETPSESELRIAQAQLVGWLEGLFHGIQATLFTQQAMAQQQLSEIGPRRALETGRRRRAPARRLPLRAAIPMTAAAAPARCTLVARLVARPSRRPATRLARRDGCSTRCSPSSAGYPPLVFAGEARSLTESLALVAEGKAFLLQAGDCAESFNAFSADGIRDKLKIILQMSVRAHLRRRRPDGEGRPHRGPVREAALRADRDPRRRWRCRASAATWSTTSRSRPRPAGPTRSRLLRGYHQSASTLNLLRAFTKGGFADLSRVHAWNQEFVTASPEGRRYEAVAAEIERALRFMEACGIDLDKELALHQVDCYTSHEALLLGYEEALTREDSLAGGWYDCSAHLLWIGDRTRQLDGAHVEFLAGVRTRSA